MSQYITNVKYVIDVRMSVIVCNSMYTSNVIYVTACNSSYTGNWLSHGKAVHSVHLPEILWHGAHSSFKNIRTAHTAFPTLSVGCAHLLTEKVYGNYGTYIAFPFAAHSYLLKICTDITATSGKFRRTPRTIRERQKALVETTLARFHRFRTECTDVRALSLHRF